MKKIVPFKKEIIFKTNLAEITSISLEHSLHKESEHTISGSFSLSGEYKITDASLNTEVFSYDLPFDIHMDDHYVLDHASIDIDDFYYEIINENVLAVNIDVCVDKLEEKPLIEKKEERNEIEKEEAIIIPKIEEKQEKREEEEEREETLVKEEMTVEVGLENKAVEIESATTTLFGNMDDSNETYMTYRVYIIREGDSIDSILSKYETTREELAYYNDLTEVKLGDKLIIPARYHEASE